MCNLKRLRQIIGNIAYLQKKRQLNSTRSESENYGWKLIAYHIVDDIFFEFVKYSEAVYPILKNAPEKLSDYPSFEEIQELWEEFIAIHEN